MAPFFIFFRTQIALFLRGKLPLFWTLAFPLLLLVILMALFGNGISLGPVKLAIVDEDHTAASASYADFARFVFVQQKTLKAHIAILAAPPNGRYDAVITIPAGFEASISKGLTARVSLSLRNSGTPSGGAIAGILNGLTDRYDLNAAHVHRTVSIREMAAEPNRSMNYPMYLVTGLSVMVVLSTSFMGFAVPLVAARENGVFRLYQVFPVHTGIILFAWWLARLIIALCSSLVLLLAANLFYNVTPTGSIIDLTIGSAMLTVGTGAFLALGMMIAALSPSVAAATMFANLVYFPLLFTGNLLMPTGSLPWAIQNIIQYLPVNALAGSLRRCFSGHIESSVEITSFLILLAVGGISLVIAHRHYSWLPQE